MSEISAPFPYFTDADGNPLDDGYVFIGTVGLDAQTNQIPVFWDSAFTSPAAQPLRTSAGYIMYQGAVSDIFVNASSWSIKVLDNRQRLVFESRNNHSDDLRGDLASNGGAGMIGTEDGGTVQDFIDASRERINAPRTYYVRTDGSDGGTGLADASSAAAPNCAFATWEAAIEAALSIDNGGFDVTIRAGTEAGVRTWNVPSLPILGPSVGNGRLKFTGNGANTVINGATNGFYVLGLIQVIVGNLKITSGGGYGSIVASGGAVVMLDTVGPIFGNSVVAHMVAHDATGYIQALNCSYTIDGTAGFGHVWAANNGTVAIEGSTVTLTGNPNVSTFALATTGGYIQFDSTMSFVGTAVGKKFSCDNYGKINTANQGINFLPGSLPGTVSNGGLYQDTSRVSFATLDVTGYAAFGANVQKIFDDGANKLTIALGTLGVDAAFANIAFGASPGLTFGNASGKVGLTSSGNLMLSSDSFSNTGARGVGIALPFGPASTTYANDAAAAGGGVPVGGLYRNGSVVQIRVV